MKLTQEQLEQFDREGYLFLPNLFSTEEAAFLKGEAEAIYQQDRQEVWREKSGVARTAFAAHQYNEGFRRLGSHPRLIEPVEQLLDGQVYMHQYKVNAKAPSTVRFGSGIRTTAPGNGMMKCQNLGP